MRRHYLFTEDEKERSVGKGKVNLLKLWHSRRDAMLEGDTNAIGGEENAVVARELTMMWDLAKPMTSIMLSRDGYIGFFARAAKALVLPLTSDAAAIAVAQRDWEYDLEGVGSVGEPTAKGVSSSDNEMMAPEQFREALMQLADLVLPVESTANVFATFLRELRSSIAGVDTAISSTEPEPKFNDPVDRLVLRPLSCIPKIGNDAFLQKIPPSSDALRTIHGLQPPDSREMSLKQLLLSYNPRKYSLTRAFPHKKQSNSIDENTNNTEEIKTNATDDAKPFVEDEVTAAQQLHSELLGTIGVGATPMRGRKLHRESNAQWDVEQALVDSLTECPALRVAVVGPPGCGKTRLARVLARRLGLRYLSLNGAIQRAVERKVRLRRLRVAAIPSADSEETTDDTPPSTETSDKDEKHPDSNADADEEMDQIFQDEHLDALLSGQVIPRDTALAILRLEATRSLLAGVGMIMDNVYPSDLSTVGNLDHSIGIDYLVALTALPNELEYQLGDSELAPAAGRLYSVRELATLKAGSLEELVAKGFADFLLPEKKSEAEAEVVRGLSISNASEGTEHGFEDQETDKPEATEDEGGDDTPPPEDSLVPPPEPTSAERNEIEPPSEPTVSFGTIFLTKFAQRYRGYVTRVQRELAMYRSTGSTDRCHLIVVQATQPLSAIRDHCIQAITGTSLGLSRFSVSREACPVSLPDDLRDANRAEKMRWLLYGDWSALLEAEGTSTTVESFARLPRRNSKHRLLSKWREFCPVTSTADNELALGDPEFAACYSGRIYLLASREARGVFCANPLQFLRREVPVSSKNQNYWLVTAGDGDIISPSYLETLEAGLRVRMVSASKLLKTLPISMEMRLMSGQVVSSVEVATVAAEALKAQLGKLDAFSGWMLTDLPLTSDVAGALLEHGCVPDMILLMDEELIAAKEEEGVVNPLAALRRQQFQTEKAGIEDITQALGGTTRVISCPLFNQPTETLAAIERELNPLAPRLDSDEDGHVPQMVDEFDPAVIFAAPNPSDDEENEGKLGSPFQQDGDDIPDPEVVAAAKAIRKKSQQLQGETGRFCPVAWRTRGALIPGLPSNVCSFRQKFYAFAGEQEQRAFERNPAAYIPSGPCATTNFVPCVLLLGVRGSGLSRIADAIAQPDTVDGYPVEYVNLDMSLVERDAERLQQLEELKSEDARMTPEELFISALQTELKKLQPNPGMNVAHIIAGLDPEPSRIPSASTLGMCFKYEVFPVLVIPLVISEEEAVEALLQQWSENLPAPRRKLALTRTKEKDGEDGDAPEKEGDEDEEPPIDLEAAREDESVRLHEQFAEDQKTLDEAISTLRSRGVRVCSPVDASGAPRQSSKRVRRILYDFMAGREALFESCDVVDMTAGGTMHQLLSSGELFVGKHGLACPVAGRAESLSPISPMAVVYRDQLYFPCSREARRTFMACPSRFLDKASIPPRHQSTCCVVGPPLSGKTRVAQELVRSLGLVYVSSQSAIDWVLHCQGGSTLRHHLMEIVDQQHNPLSDPDITHRAICARLRSSECQTRGWVLDGYFLDHPELHRSLKVDCNQTTGEEGQSQSIQPDMLFILESNFTHVWQDHQAHADKSELHSAFTRWQQYRLELLNTWTRLFGGFHVRQLDSSNKSLWHVAAEAQTFLKEQQQLASLHTTALTSSRAVQSLGVMRTRDQLQARQHPVFQTFCPVELRAGKYYTSRLSRREYCIDFRGSSFWLGSKRNAEQFIESPEIFVGCLPGEASTPRRQQLWPTQEEAESDAQVLVAKAPVDASLLSLLTVADCDFPELKGYCPVTFASGSGAKDWAALRHGSVFFRASYRSKVFFFVSEEASRKFCCEPSRYASQSLPVKLPPQVTLSKAYPGQLEQQLGAALNEVLLALGSERPKFPQVSTRASACVYLALSLKALQRRYQLKAKHDSRGDETRDTEDHDEEQKLRHEQREEQAERDAIGRLDAFVRDCRLGEQLKIASTPANTPCGSGAKVARTMRAALDSPAEGLSGIQEDTVAVPMSGELDLLRRRFDVIISGNDSEDKALPVDLHVTRMYTKAAFLEYSKNSYT